MIKLAISKNLISLALFKEKAITFILIIDLSFKSFLYELDSDSQLFMYFSAIEIIYLSRPLESSYFVYFTKMHC